MPSTALAPNATATHSGYPMWDAWLGLFKPTPDTLLQPILPGWSFNINSNNSASPQTEVDVVSEVSYGRQLGRISEALKLLIVEQHGDKPSEPALKDFLAMSKKIDELKRASSRKRLDQLKSDLLRLKHEDHAGYERLKAELLDLLKG